MNKEQTIKEIDELIDEAENKILPTKGYSGVIASDYHVDYALFSGWHTNIVFLLSKILPESSEHIKKIRDCDTAIEINVRSIILVLKGLKNYIEKDLINIQIIESPDAETELKRVFHRFHKIVRQLRNRHDNRSPLEISDEYDVQDLLHALLQLYFDDIRNEEWTPSYGGKSARMDFLLKNEQIVIEVKKTRNSLKDKEIGDQLIVDAERYQTHPDCKKLLCFVYDPEAYIANPKGLIQDLNKRYNGFAEVIIEPDN